MDDTAQLGAAALRFLVQSSCDTSMREALVLHVDALAKAATSRLRCGVVWKQGSVLGSTVVAGAKMETEPTEQEMLRVLDSWDMLR